MLELFLKFSEVKSILWLNLTFRYTRSLLPSKSTIEIEIKVLKAIYIQEAIRITFSAWIDGLSRHLPTSHSRMATNSLKQLIVFLFFFLFHIFDIYKWSDHRRNHLSHWFAIFGLKKHRRRRWHICQGAILGISGFWIWVHCMHSLPDDCSWDNRLLVYRHFLKNNLAVFLFPNLSCCSFSIQSLRLALCRNALWWKIENRVARSSGNWNDRSRSLMRVLALWLLILNNHVVKKVVASFLLHLSRIWSSKHSRNLNFTLVAVNRHRDFKKGDRIAAKLRFVPHAQLVLI